MREVPARSAAYLKCLVIWCNAHSNRDDRRTVSAVFHFQQSVSQQVAQRRSRSTHPSFVASHRSSSGSKTSSGSKASFVSEVSGKLVNTTTSGTLEGSRSTSLSVLSVRFRRELPSPLAEADIVRSGKSSLLHQWLARDEQEHGLTG